MTKDLQISMEEPGPSIQEQIEALHRERADMLMGLNLMRSHALISRREHEVLEKEIPSVIRQRIAILVRIQEGTTNVPDNPFKDHNRNMDSQRANTEGPESVTYDPSCRPVWRLNTLS